MGGSLLQSGKGGEAVCMCLSLWLSRYGSALVSLHIKKWAELGGASQKQDNRTVYKLYMSWLPLRAVCRVAWLLCFKMNKSVHSV